MLSKVNRDPDIDINVSAITVLRHEDPILPRTHSTNRGMEYADDLINASSLGSTVSLQESAQFL